MRVIVDLELCEGNGVCVKQCPEVFALGDDDKAHLRTERPPETLRPKVAAAVRGCPRQAIRVEER
jgi:ferredoxin